MWLFGSASVLRVNREAVRAHGCLQFEVIELRLAFWEADVLSQPLILLFYHRMHLCSGTWGSETLPAGPSTGNCDLFLAQQRARAAAALGQWDQRHL
jgi:hypothetical protein